MSDLFSFSLLSNGIIMTLSNITYIAAATATGLMAGLFFAFSVSVNPGLARLENTAYLQSMQHINRAILNPVFLLCFMGAVVLLLASAWMHYSKPVPAGFWLTLCAALVYIVGVLGVTMAGNVPLNNALDTFDIAHATADKLQQMRDQFEGPWSKYHMVRTWACVVSFMLVLLAKR